MRLLARFRDDERGAAIVETALVVPLGFLILAGGFEVARGLSYHHAADKAVRDVARYMARIPETDAADDTLAAKYMNERIVTPASAATTSSLIIRTVTLPDGTTLEVKVVQVASAIAYDFSLLSLLPIATRKTFTVAHEQPWVGE